MVREFQVMQTTRPAETRAAPYRAGLVEIGARATVPAPSRAHIALAFAAIYLIWGSTYLGIRYAVETIPPLLMMGTRHLTAGLFTYAFVRRRGGPAPQPAQWMYAAVLGAALFLGGHGVLAWAEQKIPSGLAALLCATLPLWTVLLGWIQRSERILGVKTWAGILLGFAAFTWLVSVTTASLVSTYAYVNPVIAVFLGWALAGEKLGVRILAATVIIVISVILVSTPKKVTREEPVSFREAELSGTAAD